MLAMKIDLLLKKFEDYSQDKAQMQTLQALETRMTCEVCGNVGHSGDNCPETQEEALFLNGNNEFRPQEGQGWNQPRPYHYWKSHVSLGLVLFPRKHCTTVGTHLFP